MKKMVLATLIIIIGISLGGCNNSAKLNNVDETNKKITIEEAKEIALKHANLTSDQVSFIRSKKDTDNGMEKYDIEFYHENKEYDYEINATDGQIIEYDYEVENYDIPQKQEQNSNISEITVDKAKEIALKHANLTSDQVSFKKVELDYDDGIKKYDIEFYFNNKEYNYEVDSNSGDILKYEQD